MMHQFVVFTYIFDSCLFRSIVFNLLSLSFRLHLRNHCTQFLLDVQISWSFAKVENTKNCWWAINCARIDRCYTRHEWSFSAIRSSSCVRIFSFWELKYCWFIVFFFLVDRSLTIGTTSMREGRNTDRCWHSSTRIKLSDITTSHRCNVSILLRMTCISDRQDSEETQILESHYAWVHVIVRSCDLISPSLKFKQRNCFRAFLSIILKSALTRRSLQSSHTFIW